VLTEPRIDARATLKSVFGYDSFRPLQEEIVDTVLRGEDVFVLMPTGGGKSLCFQLPALLREGVTVVVSPLIALMKDQVDSLQALGVPATYINSLLDLEEVNRRQEAVSRGEVKLLYVAPERLMLPGFLKRLAATQIAGFAIDEAHCISEWGHDFRPEYRELARLRELFPGVPIGAYTATATARVQADIRRQLGLGRAAMFRGGFNRPNLWYEVRPKKGAYEWLVAYLRRRPDTSGIIYCFSRAGTEDLAQRLRSDRINAIAYHAGLGAEERRRRQDAFRRDDARIVVATIAFGMGIDKPDVRFVVHMDLPKSLEGYYQESGRAGRDGEPSDCILFFSAADIVKQKRFIQEKDTEAERRVASWQLDQMAAWAGGTTCRRQRLLAYFDERFEGQPDPCCDICRTPVETEDVTVEAQKFLSCVKRTGERFGGTHVINVLRGSREERVLRFRHDQLSTYGIGRDRSVDWWRLLARELVQQGVLNQDAEHSVLSVTEQGRAVLFHNQPVRMQVAQKVVQIDNRAPETVNTALFERLRALRKQLADERNIPPYVIFHDRTLMHLAARLPLTRDEMLQIPGVGERKALDFAGPVLAAIREYVEETDAKPAELPPPPQPIRGSLSSTKLQTLELFEQGHSAEEIARMRGVAVSTIESYLADGVAAGVITNIDRLVSPERQRIIRAAMDEIGIDGLGALREHLGESYGYGELKIMRAFVLRDG
jgi:ATP-dependent DNA helicase RecQ